MLDENERLISSDRLESDSAENSLRPKTLDEYVGQEKEKAKLKKAQLNYAVYHQDLTRQIQNNHYRNALFAAIPKVQ